MTGGIQSRHKSGVPLPLADSDGDIAGGSGQPSGLPNVAHSHQRTFSNHVLDNPEQFYDDTPYVPPRISHADLTYPAPDPRGSSVYDPNFQQQYPFEGGTSPSESHHSLESWSTSSSTSSQHIHNYDLGPTSQYTLPTTRPPRLPSNPRHYPAYYGRHRIGLEHVQYGEDPVNGRESYIRPPQGCSVDGIPSTQVTYSSPSPIYVPATDRSSNIPASSSQLADDSTRPIFPDTAAYLRVQLGLSANESVSLRSLPDPPPGEKPSTPLPMLIKLAIYGSPNKRLTLQEIYNELENRFQWFRDHKHERAWKNSIRHNLSLNKVFVHVPRPITEPGKGSYWKLDVSGGEGYKRTRKRRPRNKVIASEEEETSEAEDDRLSPVDPFQSAGTSLSGTPVEDVSIDPELRSGHVVGEGRPRSATRRVGGSPYPQQSPRYQSGSLPVVAGEEAAAPGQPSIRFGHPSFGFPTYTQSRSMPLVDVPSTLLSSSRATEMATPVARPQLQNMSSYDQAMNVAQPISRAGIEFVANPGSLPVAPRVIAFSQSPKFTQGNTPNSSPKSSSSGSSQTWRDPRSGS